MNWQQPQRNRDNGHWEARRTKHHSHGVAMVEFAVLIPIALVIIGLFFDSMMKALCGVLHQSAMIQIATANSKTALRATAGTMDGIPTMNINRLTPSELIGTSGLFPEISSIFESYIENWGTGSKYVTSGIALELWYARICNDAVGACSTKSLGDAVDLVAATDSGGSGIQFHTSALSDRCFGDNGSPSRQQIKLDFLNYVNQQSGLILNPPTFPGGRRPVFGTKVLDVTTGDAAIGDLKIYLEWKPIVFVALCSVPPTLWSQKAPVVTFQTYFPDKEVSYG